MAWNNVTKPSTLSWTPVNTPGKQSYDEATVMYDDPNTYYDSVNPAMYTNIAKPTTPSSWVSIPKPV